MRKYLLLLTLLLLACAGSARGQTYSGTVVGLAPASSATDIFTVTGSASKTVYITKVVITCTQTTAGSVTVVLLKRSTANSGGTSASVTAVPHSSTSGVATASVLSYTANPTTGNLIGNVRSYKLGCLGTATASPQDIVIETFGPTNQMLDVRGTNEVFAVNLNGVTVSGGSFNIAVEWREQ